MMRRAESSRSPTRALRAVLYPGCVASFSDIVGRPEIELSRRARERVFVAEPRGRSRDRWDHGAIWAPNMRSPLSGIDLISTCSRPDRISTSTSWSGSGQQFVIHVDAGGTIHGVEISTYAFSIN